MADRGDWFALLEKVADEIDGFIVHAERVRVRHAAGEHEAVVVFDGHIADRLIDFELVGLFVVVKALDFADLIETSSGFPPASSTAFQGSVNSTCSTPQVARNAMRLP